MTVAQSEPSCAAPARLRLSRDQTPARRRSTAVLHCERCSSAQAGRELWHAAVCLFRGDDPRTLCTHSTRAFRDVPHTICYSVKANSNLSILRLLARKGCGFDVVSGGELERVLTADRKAAKKVVFSGVGKTRDELTAALKAGILLFNVESESELWVLAEWQPVCEAPLPSRYA